MNKKNDIHIRRATFRNDISDVPQLGEFILGIAAEEHINEMVADSINLALEEAVVNVMNYAYPKDTQGDVRLESRVDPGKEWTFVLSDTGTPFDPTQADDVDITLDVEDRPIGGLGIFLVRQIMSEVSYEYKDNSNILTMKYVFG